MNNVKKLIAIVIGIGGVFSCSAANLHWKNTGTDMCAAASYTENVAPTANDVIYFTSKAITQPYLSKDLTVKSIFFGRDDGARTTADTDPDGYVFTGAAGKKLTLTNTGSSNYVINSLTTGGKAVFRIPIVFSGEQPNPAANGITLVFEGPVSTTGEYTQDVGTTCNGADSSHNGMLVFSAANPDFKPKRIHIAGCCYLAVTHPEALVNVPEIMTGHWGGNCLPHFYNWCGEPLVLDSLKDFTRESYGLNDFYFEGDPFVMTNCCFGGSMRDDKSKTFNADVTLKNYGMYDYSGRYFVKSGTNVLRVLQAPYEDPDKICHTKVANGLFCPAAVDGIVYRADRKFEIGSNSSSMPPTLGLNQDVNLRIADVNGVCFTKNAGYGGFSAMSGTVHLRLTDPSGSPISVVQASTACSGQTNWMMAQRPSFGHPVANGTIVFMNDYKGPSGSTADVYAQKGGAKVAVRFNGAFTVDGSNQFQKGNDGVVAFDGSFTMTGSAKGNINAGGVLMNCSNPNTDWYVNGGWLGGKGSVTSAEVKSGGALRAGEDGLGTLTVLGTVKDTTIAAGGGIFVEISENGGAAPLVFVGAKDCKAASGSKVWVDGDVSKFAPGKGRVKIIDWSGKSGGSSLSMFDISNYQVEIVDSRRFKKAWLEKDADNKAIYLVYVRPSAGFSMVFRP